MSIEAMKTALEALEKCAVMIDGEWGSCRSLVEMDETDCLPQGVRGPIIALRTAIEAAEKQEPVTRSIKSMLQPDAYLQNGMLNPKYTTPPAAQRQWVGLTDEEIDEWTPEIHSVIQAIEAKLKEKNT